MPLPGGFRRIHYHYPSRRFEDPKAIYLDAPATNADGSAALQAAIDKASGTGREEIVFSLTGTANGVSAIFS